MLKDLNDFHEEGGVYVRDGDGDFDYSDGRDVEAYLRKVLAEAGDLSSTSGELEAAIQDWATEYHLSSRRANLLRAFDFSKCRTVLEMGCGCGAITRFLGEKGLEVDAVEGSPERAELAALRCRDLDNVSIYRANFNDIELPQRHYDLICLVGVAEYAARFMNAGNAADSEEPVVRLLRKLTAALGPDGAIFLAIENRTGMKYVLGAHEDHYGKPFIGIHNYFGVKDINTYTLPEWEAMFQEAGIPGRAVYMPFPDYKVPTVILSESFAAGNPYAFCNLEGVESRDYVELFRPPVSESLFWQSAAASGSMNSFANSFLFVLSMNGSGVDGEYRFDFAHLPSFSRRLEYCLIAMKPEGVDTVGRTKVVDAEGTGGYVRQRVIEEPYRRGFLLSVLWSRAVELEPESDRFLDLVRQYLDFLSGQPELTIDMTPANIVVDEDGVFHSFDDEWVASEEISKEFLLFRSLIIFVTKSGLMAFVYGRRRRLMTVKDFIIYVGDAVGLDLARDMDRHVEREERFQASIARARAGNRTGELLKRSMLEDEALIVPVKARLYWKTSGENYSEDRCRVVHMDTGDERQVVSFALPPGAANAHSFRFNPLERMEDDGVGFMRFYRMEVLTSPAAGGEGSCVWKLSNPGEIAKYAKMRGITYAASGLGSVFMVTDDDPFLEVPFIPRYKLDGSEYLVFRIELTLPRSREYLLARDRHVTIQEHLSRRLKQVEDLYESHLKLRRELDDIKASRFWNALAWYRKLRLNLRRVTGKLELWRLVARRRGLKRTFSRALGQAAKRAALITGREPPVAGPPTRYEIWRDTQAPRPEAVCPDGPLISVVMPVHNAAEDVLSRAIASVRQQTYRNWELCIADDASSNRDTLRVLEKAAGDRVKVRYLEDHRNISGTTNAAVELAQGDYLAFMDNDDELADDALNEAALAIQRHDADLLYTDEDFIKTDGHLDNPHFKPDYNPDLLLSHNYMTHLLVVKKELFESVGGLRSEYDGAQDYDLVLRLVERADRILHIPKPLYHWRMSEGSTSVNPTIKPAGHGNARKALEETLARRGMAGKVVETKLPHYFRVQRDITGSPLVSIVVPFRDKPESLSQCLTTVLERTTYGNFEILGISNDSVLSTTYDEMVRLRGLDDRISFHEVNEPFNFSRLVNFGAATAGGEHIVLLNSDVEIVTPEWLENLLEHSQRPEIAAVGAKLHYPDNTIQHAGLVVGPGGCAAHLHESFRSDSPGYFNRLNVIQNVSAVSGALMMIEKSKYTQIGPFDEASFTVAYNDVDFCLRALEKGYRNLFTPYVEAYHRESTSRGCEDTSEKQNRFSVEKENLATRHGEVLSRGDPYYNPNFNQDRDDFSWKHFDVPGIRPSAKARA